MHTLTILFFCLLSIYESTASSSCRDEDGNPVDWYIVYKIPRLYRYDYLIEEGESYLYITSNDVQTWRRSNISISQNNSIIGNTLKEFYQNRDALSYVLYNDEPANHAQSSLAGHTKGVVVADSQGGFWLVHSVPKFPDEGQYYFYPDTGKKYGQTFLCISMDLNNVNTVGKQLQYNEPYIYYERISKEVESRAPEFAKALLNETVERAPWSNVAEIKSKNNVAFVSFAKSSSFAEDLYAKLVGPYVRSDLDVQTWPNGSGRLPSRCTEIYHVYNVKSMRMPFDNIEFNTTSDHSKWAVTSDKSQNYWTCIGDINRSQHQYVRGGGTVCIYNQILAQHFQKLVTSVDECSYNYLDVEPFVWNV